ncbi:DUF3306 domain-containing protein [Pseudorhodobacter sp. E13]|uniref:DUF3306 domain-containing protein n=1 Tax=Pseudorhodobacter sp. E13 TaxID=2487931 RepID=UPI000F8D75DD|nr:DUF3306 domain-containing protein [Pseudorhodobacter sp. E13]RUS59244.1 DUF3306 domain-containing protein [Pseudorhodobacter sp. E13]
MQGATSFWARRKAAVQAEAAAEAAAVAAEAQARAEAAEAEALAAAQAEKTDAEILADLGLPDPDNLAMGDDFSGFMARAVPEHLRRRALRKLWVSNPVLANLDGLVDHGEDYTDAATVIPGMQTAYQVGKGMMRHVIALAEQAAAKEAALEEAEQMPDMAQDMAAPEADIAEADCTEPTMAAPELAPTAHRRAEPEADAALPPRRHMRFDFAS